MTEIDFSRYASSKPIREITYEALKDAIISGEIAPGERIIESVYATKFNISRTPVREALRKLEQDDLVEYIPRRGVIVKSLNDDDINEIYIIRQSLESLAIEFAVKHVTTQDILELREILNHIDSNIKDNRTAEASRLSRELHTRIYELSELNRLVSMVATLDEYMDRFSYLSLTDESRRREAAKEHAQIVDALEARDVVLLKKVSECHLESARQNCLKAYDKQRSEAKRVLAKRNRR